MDGPGCGAGHARPPAAIPRGKDDRGPWFEPYELAADIAT